MKIIGTLNSEPAEEKLLVEMTKDEYGNILGHEKWMGWGLKDLMGKEYKVAARFQRFHFFSDRDGGYKDLDKIGKQLAEMGMSVCSMKEQIETIIAIGETPQ